MTRKVSSSSFQYGLRNAHSRLVLAKSSVIVLV